MELRESLDPIRDGVGVKNGVSLEEPAEGRANKGETGQDPEKFAGDSSKEICTNVSSEFILNEESGVENGGSLDWVEERDGYTEAWCSKEGL